MEQNINKIYQFTIKTSPGTFFDYLSILEIKKNKGINLSVDALNDLTRGYTYLERCSSSFLKLYWKLVHINERIWWCMDKQRQFIPQTINDRKEIGLIIAILNDGRDKVKQVINNLFKMNSICEEKKYE
jgi:hypothetical protein